MQHYGIEQIELVDMKVINWKLQRNNKGWFTGLLVNQFGETKPCPRGRAGKFVSFLKEEVVDITEQDVIKAFIAGLSEHRSKFNSLEKQAEFYMQKVKNDKETLAQRKV